MTSVAIPCGDITMCTGCEACVQICPTQAISMQLDDLKSTFPKIDESKCCHCSKCQKVCPIQHVPNIQKSSNAYAAIAKDELIYETTSSGGAATVFAENIVRTGGVVYGAGWEDGRVKHIRITDVVDVERIKGSKYVKSDTNDCYKYLIKDLKKGKKVLFIGTPCQCAAAENYGDGFLEQLLCVDLVCHGVPPMDYLQEHIRSLLKDEKSFSKVTFRQKEWALKVFRDQAVVVEKGHQEDAYFVAFLRGLIFRSNCYRCLFARQERCADITVGDFWGLGNSTLPNKTKSLILTNTEKGKAFWNEVSADFIYEERKTAEAINGNAQLQRPSSTLPIRRKFEEEYRIAGLEKAFKSVGIMRYIKFVGFKRKIKNMLDISHQNRKK